MRISVSFLVIAVLLFAGRAHAAQKMDTAKFQSVSGLEITGYYFRPKGDGPFPAVIGMHGCGGLFEGSRKVLAPNRMDWAQRFIDAGYVVLFPDSYQPRGFRTVCEIKPGERTIRLPDQVGDLAGAVAWLSAQPFVDKDRIALIGWGTGGSAVLRILDPQFPIHQTVDIKGAIAFYPHCEPLERAPSYAPRLTPTILMGAADEWVSPIPCKALAERWGSPIVLYPGAYHNFDVPGMPVRTRKTGERLKRAGTNPAARDKAIKEVKALLAKAFDQASTGARPRN